MCSQRLTYLRLQLSNIANGEVVFAPTELLNPALKRLLDVRRVVGLRNPGHSVVKLMQPCEGACVVVGSYTHPAYADSMAAAFELLGIDRPALARARGRGGGGPAPHRRRSTASCAAGASNCRRSRRHPAMPGLPGEIDVASTAAYTRRVLAGERRCPPPSPPRWPTSELATARMKSTP